MQDYEFIRDLLVTLKIPGIFFAGLSLLLFSLLRLYHWNAKDMIFLGGLGLAILLFGLTLFKEFKYPYTPLWGFALSISFVFLYYFFINRVADSIALGYAIGIAILTTAILVNATSNSTHRKAPLLLENLEDQVQADIQPEDRELSFSEDELIDLSMIIWRLEKRIDQLDSNFSESHRRSFEYSFQQAKRLLLAHEIDIIDHANQKYLNSLNIDVLAVEKDPSIVEPQIRETVEPSIMFRGRLIKRGKIVVVERE